MYKKIEEQKNLFNNSMNLKLNVEMEISKNSTRITLINKRKNKGKEYIDRFEKKVQRRT